MFGLESLTDLLENYGWYILLISVVLVVFFRKFVNPVITKYMEYKSEKEYAAKYHKNPDLLAARMAAQEAFVKKLQEQHDKEAKLYEEKMKKKEEKRREELLQKYVGDGHILGDRKTLKSDYNPLMGSSGPSCRFPKRKTCSGGGCGK